MYKVEEQPEVSGVQRPQVLTEEKQAEVDRYTLETREEGERLPSQPPLHRRVAVAFESINRKFWYKLLHAALNNPPVTKKIPISELESLLIVPFGDAVGDMIVALPIVDAIKRRNPNTRIGVVTSARNESLLRCEPNIAAQYSFIDRSDWKHYGELRRARKDNYQVLLNVHFARMSDYGIIANIMAPKAVKVSVTHQTRKNLYTALFNHLSNSRRFKVHLTQLSLKLLDDVIDFDPPLLNKEARLRLTLCPDTVSVVTQRVDQELRRIGAKWFIYLNPEARNPFREMGIEKIVEFCRTFTRYFPEAAVFITSSPVRQPEVKEMILSHGLERVVFFDTSYDLLELGVLCRLSTLVVTPDTSLIHFAAAEQKPSVILWSDRKSLPMEWLPLHVPCRHLAPAAHAMPVSTIAVEEIMRSVVDLIEGKVQVSHTSYDLDEEPFIYYQHTTADQALVPLVDPFIDFEKTQP